MGVLRESLRVGGLSMAVIFIAMAGLYAMIRILMNGERRGG